jgi:hypothetical protein
VILERSTAQAQFNAGKPAAAHLASLVLLFIGTKERDSMPTLTSVDRTDLSAPVAPPDQPVLVSVSAHRPWVRVTLVVLLLAGVVALATRVLPALFSTPPSTVVRASGRIEGRQVTLAPKEIQARVKRLLVDEGATVKEGQVLAELESKQLDARSAALHANLANIDTQIRQASIDVSSSRAHGTPRKPWRRGCAGSACCRRCATSSISVTV